MDMATCVHGCNSLESESHLFFHCQVEKAVWFAMPWSIRWDDFTDFSLEEKLALLAEPARALPVHPNYKEYFFFFFFLYGALILDQIWKIKNSFKFENKFFSLENTMDLLNFRYKGKRSLCKEWFRTL